MTAIPTRAFLGSLATLDGLAITVVSTSHTVLQPEVEDKFLPNNSVKNAGEGINGSANAALTAINKTTIEAIQSSTKGRVVIFGVSPLSRKLSTCPAWTFTTVASNGDINYLPRRL